MAEMVRTDEGDQSTLRLAGTLDVRGWWFDLDNGELWAATLDDKAFEKVAL